MSEIEKYREELNSIMSNESIDYEKALSMSQVLDKLILEYYKKSD